MPPPTAAKAERILVPLLDTLQSIPVLSFLPGVMVAMIALAPTRQLGVEMGSILLIFTGQVWNMAFSFYSSLRNIPPEMIEAATVYRLSWWQRLIQLELPYAAIGLVWNSIMSVAGGWFFLMACEMFVLGNRDLRLPGLGSYLQTAANAGDTGAILWGVAAMIAVIVMMDQLLWRPIIAWSEKFKFEQVEAAEVPRSPILTLLRRSKLVSRVGRITILPAREALTLHIARSANVGRTPSSAKRPPGRLSPHSRSPRPRGHPLRHRPHAHHSFPNLQLRIGRDLLGRRRNLPACRTSAPPGRTLDHSRRRLRRLRPRLSAIAQPIAQIAASVPATALFPVVLLLLIRVGGGMGIASIVLLLLGTQWYILFNVIAGASAIPTDLKEVCDVFRLRKIERWRTLFLPGIFPFMITGFITASGWRVERQHRRRVFPLSQPDLLDHRLGSDHQPCHRHGKLPGPDGRHGGDGRHGRHHESPPLEASLRPGLHQIPRRVASHPVR